MYLIPSLKLKNKLSLKENQKIKLIELNSWDLDNPRFKQNKDEIDNIIKDIINGRKTKKDLIIFIDTKKIKKDITLGYAKNELAKDFFSKNNLEDSIKKARLPKDAESFVLKKYKETNDYKYIKSYYDRENYSEAKTNYDLFMYDILNIKNNYNKVKKAIENKNFEELKFTVGSSVNSINSLFYKYLFEKETGIELPISEKDILATIKQWSGLQRIKIKDEPFTFYNIKSDPTSFYNNPTIVGDHRAKELIDYIEEITTKYNKSNAQKFILNKTIDFNITGDNFNNVRYSKKEINNIKTVLLNIDKKPISTIMEMISSKEGHLKSSLFKILEKLTLIYEPEYFIKRQANIYGFYGMTDPKEIIDRIKRVYVDDNKELVSDIFILQPLGKIKYDITKQKDITKLLTQ